MAEMPQAAASTADRGRQQLPGDRERWTWTSPLSPSPADRRNAAAERRDAAV
jgi:hypothetical protein